MSRAELRSASDPGDLICPFLVAACLVSKNAVEGSSECWKERCRMWLAEDGDCGLKRERKI